VNEHEVESVLRSWYRVEVSDEVIASAALQRRVRAIEAAGPSRFRAGDRRLLMVAAALVISTVLLAMIAAFGSGLLRLPVALIPSPVPPTPTAPPTASAPPTPSAAPTSAAGGTLTAMADPLGGSCSARLPDGVALQLVIEPAGSSGSPNAQMVVVMDDGTVLTGQRGQVRFDEGLRQRRLSAAGVKALERVVTEAQLPNCQQVPLESSNANYSLAARADGVELAVSYSPGLSFRQSSDEELDKIDLLAERLLNLDAWLDSASWTDLNWRQFLPDSWRLMVVLGYEPFDGCKTGPSLSPSDLAACAPWVRNVSLPDGTPLLAFGAYYPREMYPEGGYRSDYRCEVISDQVAANIVEAFHLGQPLEAGIYSRYWDTGSSLMNDNEAFGDVTIELMGLLPGDAGCEPYRPLAEPTGSPPADLAPSIDPCTVIEGSLEPSALRRVRANATPDGRGWWTSCWSWDEAGDFEVFVRGRATSGADGASWATTAFGAGVESVELLGRAVFWNDCFRPQSAGEHIPELNASPCSPAAAVVSPPHLVVFRWNGDHTRAEFGAILEGALREGLIP